MIKLGRFRRSFFSFLPEKAAVRRNLLRIEQPDDVTVVQRRVKRKKGLKKPVNTGGFKKMEAYKQNLLNLWWKATC